MSQIPALESDLKAARAYIKELEAKYNELLYQVQNKVDGETRHETAKRIIRQHENQTNGQTQALEGGE